MYRKRRPIAVQVPGKRTELSTVVSRNEFGNDYRGELLKSVTMIHINVRMTMTENGAMDR